VSPHIDPRRFTDASGRERAPMLAHLRTCPSCQRAVAAHDPTALFGLLALTPMPPALLDDLSAAVARAAGTDRPSIGVLADAALWPRRAAAAAVFVLTLLSGYATIFERWVAPLPISLSSRRADVEVDSGRGVSQVIDLTVGETQIVMVYNGDLNL
jgi:anti-sigma factor RsiW